MRHNPVIILLLLACFTGQAFAAQPISQRQAAQPANPPQAADQFVLNMASIYPAEHPMIREVLRPWAEALLEQSGGRLVIRIHEPGAISGPIQIARSVRLGQAGLGCGLMTLEPEQFQLGILAAQAPGTMAIRELSGAYWKLFNEVAELAAEFSGIKLLAVYASGPYQLCMTRGLPYDAASMAGRSFLADHQITARKLEALGAKALVAPQVDFKMYMDDRLSDGVIVSLSDLRRLGLESYISGVTLGDLENGVLWFGMHQGDWETLPQDLQRLVTQSSGLALSQKLGEASAALYRAQIEKLLASDIEVHYLSAEERANFQRNSQNIIQAAWQEICAKRGLNPRILWDRASRILAEAGIRR